VILHVGVREGRWFKPPESDAEEEKRGGAVLQAVISGTPRF
jgi:hypothetical protein